MLRAFSITLLVIGVSSTSLAQDMEHVAGDQPGATEAEIQATLGSDLVKELSRPPPGVLTFTKGELDGWVKKAKNAHSSLQTDLGASNKVYDIIVQAGHYPRPKDATPQTASVTGGQGVYVKEQEYTAWISQMMVNDLRKRGLSVALVPADKYTKPLKARIFLSLHTDSSKYPCSIGSGTNPAGASIGYNSAKDSTGMNGIALGLATALGIDPASFMRDNYTKNLSGYYAFSSMDVELFEGILEMSELTCPKQEENLLANAERLANNLTWAVVFALKPAVVK
jgi:hypothetical protein